MTGIFAIIVCGTLGTMAIHFAAPRLLLPAEEGSGSDDDGEEEEDSEEEQRSEAGPEVGLCVFYASAPP